MPRTLAEMLAPASRPKKTGHGWLGDSSAEKPLSPYSDADDSGYTGHDPDLFAKYGAPPAWGNNSLYKEYTSGKTEPSAFQPGDMAAPLIGRGLGAMLGKMQKPLPAPDPLAPLGPIRVPPGPPAPPPEIPYTPPAPPSGGDLGSLGPMSVPPAPSSPNSLIDMLMKKEPSMGPLGPMSVPPGTADPNRTLDLLMDPKYMPRLTTSQSLAPTRPGIPTQSLPVFPPQTTYNASRAVKKRLREGGF